MICIYTFGTGRHNRKTDITLLFEYIQYETAGSLSIANHRDSTSIIFGILDRLAPKIMITMVRSMFDMPFSCLLKLKAGY